MKQKINFNVAATDAIVGALGQQLDQIRLSRNLTQSALAREAGVSRSTLTRMADGQSISLDSFVRIMRALGLSDHLAALLPDPSVRPVERVAQNGRQRQRARSSEGKAKRWQWGDEQG